ncbi:MAG: YncE family protein [Clostridium sp.]|uniref:YncE family protein n=1 Tax=Clostridium sp. TaxID=1506 RepID=UPI003D6D27FE
MKRHKVYLCMLVLFFIIADTPNKVVTATVQTSQVSSQINYTVNSNNKKEKSTLLENDLLFNIKDKNNLQGITFFNKYLYCGFDIGGGKGKIVKYNMAGERISQTKPMMLGHCADLSYRTRTNKIYVANGGGNNLTRIYVVDYEKGEIQSTLNYERLGTSALLAIDNVHDYLILHTVLNHGDAGNPTFTIIDLAKMKAINSFNVACKGVPQGLETDGKYIYLYTNNKITVFNYQGAIIATYHVNKRGESEGITIISDHGATYLAVGYNSPNRFYKILIKS